jgi:A/G-specific adenine glycosylase
LDYAALRRKLARWFEKHRRDLPWRRTRDPYAIWISEIMLQQTRVAAVISYYKRFLRRFPDAETLARAKEREVLALWSGLGYYSRARNLRRAAREIVAGGGFPRDYAGIRALAGVGDYTAAAVASIAFGLPHACVDGNVRRVITRLAGDARVDVAAEAGKLLDRRSPGRANQALMELGALVCLPRRPRCGECPVNAHCMAFREGLQHALPPPKARPGAIRRERTLLVIRWRGRLLLVPSVRVKGFWDLPEPFETAKLGATLGSFRHAITTTQYRFEVREARAAKTPPGAIWWSGTQVNLSTAARKALKCLRGV